MIVLFVIIILSFLAMCEIKINIIVVKFVMVIFYIFQCHMNSTLCLMANGSY